MMGKMIKSIIPKRLQALAWGLFLASLLGCTPTEQEAWALPCSSSFEFYPLRWGPLLILSSECEGVPCIKGVSLRSGQEAWSLSDSLFSQVYYNFQPYLDEDYLVLPIGRELLCLSPESGEVRWRHQHERPGDAHVFGDGRFVYRSYRAPSDSAFEWVRLELTSGRDSLLLTAPVSLASRCLMRSPMPFFDGRDSGLVSPVIDYTPRGNTQSYLLLWKQGQAGEPLRHTIYPDNSQGVGAALPAVLSGKLSFWVTHRDLTAFDLEAGQELWRISLPHGLLTSRLSKHGECLYLACENERLYAISAADGHIRWSLPNSGTPSRIFHTEDRIFLIGGADQLLYEIDRSKGQILSRYAGKTAERNLRRPAYFSSEAALINDGARWKALPSFALRDSLKVLPPID